MSLWRERGAGKGVACRAWRAPELAGPHPLLRGVAYPLTVYLYRAVDRDGQTLDFMLSERRDLAAARRFFKKAIEANGVPERIVIDKSGANLAGLQAVNTFLKFTGTGRIIEIRQVKYLNNILEQDHRFIKRLTRPMMGSRQLIRRPPQLRALRSPI